MPGLVPGIHVFSLCYIKQDVDGRDKPGHDVSGSQTVIARSSCDEAIPAFFAQHDGLLRFARNDD
jgi:hypothetical protein